MALDKGKEDGTTSTKEVADAIKRKTESNMGKSFISKIMAALKSKQTLEKSQTRKAEGEEHLDPEECKKLLTDGDFNGNVNTMQTPSTEREEDMDAEKK